MATDMDVWKKRAIEQFDRISDEEWQRLVWFGGGGGKWVDSPNERIEKFYDLLIPRVLSRPDHGLNQDQVSAALKLSGMMDDLCDNTPDWIKPSDLIDDPRWRDIRAQAAVARNALSRPA